MRKIKVIATVAALGVAAACGKDGASTEEVRVAAIEKARAELGIAADIPLDATVWTGQPFNDQLTVCGTVSSSGAQQMRAQRFIATTDPLEWQVFEDAHSPMIPSQPGKFPEWSRICGASGQP